jgi:hypothetical protein
MSDEQNDIVAKAEALLANVTPGAWEWVNDNLETSEGERVLRPGERVLSPSGRDVGGIDATDADAAFIATAPELVRALVDEVKRLRSELGVQE